MMKAKKSVNRLFFSLMAGGVLLMAFPGISAAIDWTAGQREAQVQLGIAPGGALYGAGVEFGPEGKKSSFTARLAGFSWSYDEDTYSEEGSGIVIGLGGRFYTEKQMSGMFFGGHLDFVSADADWYDYPNYGTVSVSGFLPGISIGYKYFPEGMQAILEPNLYFGILSGDVEVGAIITVGINLGMRF